MNKRQTGFTLIELMVSTAITGILAAIAYPSFQGPIFKARRSDGITALLQIQMSQERWRSNHSSYANLAELNTGSGSSLHYYQLDITEASATGFTAAATGTGAQASDSACRVLRITVTDGHTSYTSGANDHTTNTSANNKRCWNL